MYVSFPPKILKPFGRLDRIEFASWTLYTEVYRGMRKYNRNLSKRLDNDQLELFNIIEEDGSIVTRLVTTTEEHREVHVFKPDWLFPKPTPVDFNPARSSTRSSALYLPGWQSKIYWAPHAWEYQEMAYDFSNLDEDIRTMIRFREHLRTMDK